MTEYEYGIHDPLDQPAILPISKEVARALSWQHQDVLYSVIGGSGQWVIMDTWPWNHLAEEYYTEHDAKCGTRSMHNE
jgi:hypothetical protein